MRGRRIRVGRVCARGRSPRAAGAPSRLHPGFRRRREASRVERGGKARRFRPRRRWRFSQRWVAKGVGRSRYWSTKASASTTRDEREPTDGHRDDASWFPRGQVQIPRDSSRLPSFSPEPACRREPPAGRAKWPPWILRSLRTFTSRSSPTQCTEPWRSARAPPQATRASSTSGRPP